MITKKEHSALKLRVRTKKSDSAFVYFTLEAHEGLTAYRTLPHQTGDVFRDIELTFSSEHEEDVNKLILDLSKRFWIETVR
jgi:hypothetical protein